MKQLIAFFSVLFTFSTLLGKEIPRYITLAFIVLILYSCSDSNEQSLLTELPDVITSEIIDNPTFLTYIAGTSAKGGGFVINEGSSFVYERGLCWNTTGSPVINIDNCDSDGSGVGMFNNVVIENLTENTIYYVRAYANNNHGIVYGDEIYFNSGYKFDGTKLFGGYVVLNNGSGGGLIVGIEDISTDLGVEWAEAVQMCNAYNGEGFLDWFLPSKNELNLIWINLVRIWDNQSNSWENSGLGNFATTNYYWSSSVEDHNYAWSQNFISGTQILRLKIPTGYGLPAAQSIVSGLNP